MSVSISQNGLEWLVIFLIYNNKNIEKDYDLSKTENIVRTVEYHKTYILNIIKNLPESENIKFVAAENLINICEPKPETAIFLYEKINDTIQMIVPDKEVKLDKDLQHQSGLEKVLDYFIKRHNASRHILITIGHGSIIGINYTLAPILKPEDNKTNEQKLMIEQEVDFIRSNTFYKNYGNSWFLTTQKKLNIIANYKSLLGKGNNLKLMQQVITKQNEVIKILTVKEINNSLLNVLPKKKLDFLVMHNCVMQNLFTQYELRKTVDFLVAPESGITHPGYNYQSVFNEIITNPLITNEKLASSFVNSISSLPNYKTYQNDIKTWSINAIQLKEDIYDKIKILFDQLCVDLMVDDVRHYKVLQETLRHLFDYSMYCLDKNKIRIKDLHAFLKFLPKGLINYPIAIDNNNFENLILCLKSLQNYPYQHKDFFNDNKENYYVDKEKIIPTGFGILFLRKNYTSSLLENILTDDNSPLIPELIAGKNKYRQILQLILKRDN